MIYSLQQRTIETASDDYFIAPTATIIGSAVIKKNASIWFNTVIRADNDVITIGEGTNIQDGCVLHTDAGIPMTIGENVTVGHMVMLHGCTIGENTLIGIKSVILNRVVIGKNCIIGANSLIPEGKIIPDGSVVMGSPGKIIRQVSEDDIVHIKMLADHYIKNFKRYKKELKPV
jgi:carbonic anhydrase/acetyltransferase-like protein (isoleucine patch superfamily)